MTEAPPSRRAQPDYGRTQEYGPAQPEYRRSQPDYAQTRAEAEYDYGYQRASGRSKTQKRRRKGPLVLLVVVLLLGGSAAAVAFGGRSLLPVFGTAATPKPVGLSNNPAGGRGGGAVAGNPDGSWVVQRGNATFVGYRVREKFGALPAPNDAVGRTPAVVGGMTIRNGQVTAALVTGDLRQLRSDKERRDNVIRANGLQTNSFPSASFQLTRPINLVAARITYGRVANLNATGTLTMHGITRPVQLPLQGRWDGNTLQVVGRLPVNFAEFQIQPPSVAGFVTVQNQGQIELNLVFQRSSS